MNLRLLISLVALAAALSAATPAFAQAQSPYPSRPIRLVVGFPPGASSDVVARLVAARLGEGLAQPMTVENRPGGGSSIGAEAVVRAAPDGYTLLLATVANAINASLMKGLSFDLLQDLVPIAAVATVPNLLVVHPSVTARTVPEFIALAKAKPASLLYASSGSGTGSHLAGELFSMMADVKMVHVPYKGSPQAVTDLLAGRVLAMFSPTSTVLPHIKAGTLRGLASTGAQRTAAAPELPTVAESGLPGYEATVWFGLMAPRGTPREIVGRLNREAGRALSGNEVRAQFAAQGMDQLAGSPEHFADFVRIETVKWARVVQASGAKAD